MSLETTLVGRYGWSLHQIDQTDMESLLEFVLYQGRGAAGGQGRTAYADQVDWL